LPRDKTMTEPAAREPILLAFDSETRALVRLSAVITAGSERELRDAVAGSVDHIPVEWVEELILQSYVFAGFPRALNAMREWRRVQPAPVSNSLSRNTAQDVMQWRRDGRETCEAVYGSMYDKLRENITTLHPLLDDWMITEGYGKVLSRPGLDLPRRELCIVAACAAAGQERQLHSHLHGARNVGVAPAVIDECIVALADLLDAHRAQSLRLLWARVRGK
jgi:4-carboxymuconolactone decarboxylase